MKWIKIEVSGEFNSSVASFPMELEEKFLNEYKIHLASEYVTILGEQVDRLDNQCMKRAGV